MRRPRRRRDAYSSYYNNNGFYDPGATSCYGECHPNEDPCEPGCTCTGGGSGNDWWGTCTSDTNTGGSVRLSEPDDYCECTFDSECPGTSLCRNCLCEWIASPGGNGKWANDGGSIMRKRRHRRRRKLRPGRPGWRK